VLKPLEVGRPLTLPESESNSGIERSVIALSLSEMKQIVVNSNSFSEKVSLPL
jgi:hypothetical protein